MSWVWESGPADQSERFVLLALADYANDEGECWPSMAGIAAKVCMSERGVRKVVRQLEDGGWISTKIGGGRRAANAYKITTNPEPRSAIDSKKGGTTFPPEPRSPGTTFHKPGTTFPTNPEPRSAEPSSNHQEPSLSARKAEPFQVEGTGPSDDRFAEFWAAYPKPEGRDPAEVEFIRACVTTPADTIIAGASAYAASRSGQEPRFTMQAARWLKERRWTDTPTPAEPPPKSAADRFRRIAASYGPTT